MKSKSHEYIYKKILRDVKRYVSRKRNNSKLYYIDDDGLETGMTFDFIPTRDEIEGLLIFLNKDKKWEPKMFENSKHFPTLVGLSMAWSDSFCFGLSKLLVEVLGSYHGWFIGIGKLVGTNISILG